MDVSAGKLWALRRLADAGGRFKMTAVDQRPPIMGVIQAKTGREATFDEVAEVKAALVRALGAECSAMLMDPVWALPRAIGHLPAGKGLIVTLEDHRFAENAKGGRLSQAIADVSVAKIKRMGGDGVKVLAWYRPDADEECRRHQRDFVESVGRACRDYDIPFIFELLVYPLPGDADQTKDYAEHAAKRPENVIKSVEVFADPRFGIDVFKLESPIPAAEIPDPDSRAAAATQAWFDRLGAASPVPWVMLSAGADMAAFERVVTYACRAGASGYLAGRAIWLDAMAAYPDLGAVEARLRAEGVAYMRRLNDLTDRLATPWTAHRAFGGQAALRDAGAARFPAVYPSFPGA